MKTHSLPLFLALLGSLASASAADWPHWLGPNGNNQTTAEGFHADLGKYKTAWQTQIGRGYSSVAVAGNRAFVLGHDGKSDETVFCFEAATGKELWKFSYPAELLPKMHPGGPNATPTIVGERVLVVSKDGQLLCLNTADGAKRWQVNLTEAMGVEVPNWGFGSSPVVTGDQVLVSAGKLIALDFNTGKTLWLSREDRPAAYASPVPFTKAGTKYIAAVNGNGLSIHSAIDGAEIAHRPMKAQFNLLAPTPLVLEGGGRILASANSGSELLGFDGKTLTPVWTSTELKNSLNNSVVAGGTIYGIDGPQNKPSSRLVAMDAADGKVLWSKDNFGYGTTIGVGDALLALTETGELVTAKISSKSYEELGRQQILAKTCWTTPTVAGGRIYVRNDQGALVCLAAN